jgi:hypothetical protein
MGGGSKPVAFQVMPVKDAPSPKGFQMIEPTIEGTPITLCSAHDLSIIINSDRVEWSEITPDAPFTSDQCFDIVQSIASWLLREK